MLGEVRSDGTTRLYAYGPGPNDPFGRLRATGEWTPAGELAIGAVLRRADGSIGRVQAIAFAATPQIMYNMTVADAHTYTVGDGEWVACSAVSPI